MTVIEVIAQALGNTYTARGDAVAIIEDLKSAGFAIVRDTRIDPPGYPD